MRLMDVRSLQCQMCQGTALRPKAARRPAGLAPRRPSTVKKHGANPIQSLGFAGMGLGPDGGDNSDPQQAESSVSCGPDTVLLGRQQQQEQLQLPQQQQLPHWQWLVRVGCCAITAVAALGILVSSASADFTTAAAAGAAASSAAAPASWQVRSERGVTAAAGAAARAQRIAEQGGDDVSLYRMAAGVATGGPEHWEAAFVASSSSTSRLHLGRADAQHQHQQLQQLPATNWDTNGDNRLAVFAAAPASALVADPLSSLDTAASPSLRFALDRSAPDSPFPMVEPASASSAGPRAAAASPLALSPSASVGRNTVSSSSSVRPAGGSSSGDGRALSGDLASETEDRLLEAARQVEARVEGMLGALVGGVPQLLAGPEAPADVARSTAAAHALIREVWEVVDANYLDARATGFDRQRWAELRDAALSLPYRDTAGAYRAVRDLLARGLSDPYCRFIGPVELEPMKKYDVSGVGLNLGTASEYVIKTGNDLPAPRNPSAVGGVFVVGVSKGSIADVAGIRQGDELLEIQGEALAESTPFWAAGLISGAAEQSVAGEGQPRRKSGQAGDVVRVKVQHASGQVEELSLVRPRRTLPSTVIASINRSVVQLPGGGRTEELVGTVRLSAFNARAQADVAAAIRQLESAGATRLILDLRDNRGGLVTEGLEVARLFLDGDAPIVITERRDALPDTPRAPGPALTDAPLLVLVNGHTASASEIVAGALHDNCRAVLAGSRTYGKGLIQSVYELSDGSGLVITVGKYLTPRGTDIDRYGIKPDFSSVPSGVQYDSTVKACKLSSAPTIWGMASGGEARS